jgi:hypothetical protein
MLRPPSSFGAEALLSYEKFSGKLPTIIEFESTDPIGGSWICRRQCAIATSSDCKIFEKQKETDAAPHISFSHLSNLTAQLSIASFSELNNGWHK